MATNATNKHLWYMAATMTYGGVRKALIVKDAEIQDRITNRKVPVLYSQKVLLVGLGALSSIYLWPFYTCIDIAKLEINARRLKQEDYMLTPSCATSIMDYLF